MYMDKNYIEIIRKSIIDMLYKTKDEKTILLIYGILMNTNH